MTIVVISGGAGKIIWIITLTFGSHQVIFLCVVIRLALNILDGVICGEASLPKIKELHLSIVVLAPACFCAPAMDLAGTRAPLLLSSSGAQMSLRCIPVFTSPVQSTRTL